MIKMNCLILFLLISFVTIITTSCDNGNGLFGHSETREEAKANGSTVVEYVPDKTNFNLLDGTKMQVDTAWTELSFTYQDGKKNLDSTYGYNFAIPYKLKDPESFTFTFSLADTTNQMFTNPRDKNACRLRPIKLYDVIQVLLEQKDTDTTIGWMHTIITDTITFTRIK